MYIILGEIGRRHEHHKIAKKYTVLTLDKFRLDPGKKPLVASCIIEGNKVPLEEIPKLAEFTNLHENLMIEYYKKNWNYCENALEHLSNKWGGELQTFYSEIESRVAKYKEEDPGDDWDGVINKY
jgi:hypothetical protein